MENNLNEKATVKEVKPIIPRLVVVVLGIIGGVVSLLMDSIVLALFLFIASTIALKISTGKKILIILILFGLYSLLLLAIQQMVSNGSF